MRGPYDYVPPWYWLTDTKNGGAFGFATEMGPGAAVPPIESLRTMLPADRLWPMNEFWMFHAGGDEFKDLKLFTQALEARYGKATSAEDYARKAQALAYEGQRAMFEAFGRNKYGDRCHPVDAEQRLAVDDLAPLRLLPAAGGGYYGTKQGLRAAHVQYSYDDRSVAVVNDTHDAAKGLTVSAQVLDLNLREAFSKTQTIDVPADGVTRAFIIPAQTGPPTTYFVRLTLTDSSPHRFDELLLALDSQDELDWAATKWFYTPTKRHADLTALTDSPATSLAWRRNPRTAKVEDARVVVVENTGPRWHFRFICQLVDAESGDETLPVFWDANYFELLPGEKRAIRVTYPRQVGRALRDFEAEAWNVAACPLRGPVTRMAGASPPRLQVCAGP